ncbi:MAG: hypothetical protein ACLP59_00585 [Bryobacteraceae bacterium]
MKSPTATDIGDSPNRKTRGALKDTRGVAQLAFPVSPANTNTKQANIELRMNPPFLRQAYHIVPAKALK